MTKIPPKLISYKELRPLFNEKRSRGALRRAVKAGEFPAPRALGPQLRAWIESELIEYYTKLAAAEYEAA
jgi:predicted DNA-binding transcriptional regulator AlpA